MPRTRRRSPCPPSIAVLLHRWGTGPDSRTHPHPAHALCPFPRGLHRVRLAQARRRAQGHVLPRCLAPHAERRSDHLAPAPARRRPPPPHPKPRGAPHPALSTAAGTLGDLAQLTLDPVRGPVDSRQCNDLVAEYHYLGDYPLPGAQMRYFIHRGRQLLGVLGFGAAAWKIAPRDDFIGWTPQQRQARLHLVVNNARFLLLPWVSIRYLASSVLALAARQLPVDWTATMPIDPSSWKPSSSATASAAPRIVRPTGSISARPRAAASSTATTSTPNPSRTSISAPSTGASVNSSLPLSPLPLLRSPAGADPHAAPRHRRPGEGAARGSAGGGRPGVPAAPGPHPRRFPALLLPHPHPARTRPPRHGFCGHGGVGAGTSCPRCPAASRRRARGRGSAGCGPRGSAGAALPPSRRSRPSARRAPGRGSAGRGPRGSAGVALPPSLRRALGCRSAGCGPPWSTRVACRPPTLPAVPPAPARAQLSVPPPPARRVPPAVRRYRRGRCVRPTPPRPPGRLTRPARARAGGPVPDLARQGID